MANFIDTAGDFKKEKAINRREYAFIGLCSAFTAAAGHSIRAELISCYTIKARGGKQIAHGRYLPLAKCRRSPPVTGTTIERLNASHCRHRGKEE